MNELPVLPSVSCQRHRFWQLQASQVANVIQPLFFSARLVDGSQACTATVFHFAGMMMMILLVWQAIGWIIVTNKVQCKLQKYKNAQLQSQLYPRHNGPNNKV